MRQCIELGLHRPPITPFSPLEEQRRRNVFWDSYVHDRYSSGILGRPYAIAEEDIEVELPIAASEEEILESSKAHLSEIPIDEMRLPNESSVALFVIGLRSITTRIQIHFFSVEDTTSVKQQTISYAGKLQAKFSSFLNELSNWRASAPIFENPLSLYQRAEWYDFLVEKDKLLLIRGMIARQPIAGLPPSTDLLAKCLDCARKVIELYGELYARGSITWTRSYFQILFTSGLSIMYSLSSLDAKLCTSDSSKEASVLQGGTLALLSCSRLLHQLVIEMPDISRFAHVFDVLSKRYSPQVEQRTLCPNMSHSEQTYGVTQTDTGLSNKDQSFSGIGIPVQTPVSPRMIQPQERDNPGSMIQDLMLQAEVENPSASFQHYTSNPVMEQSSQANENEYELPPDFSFDINDFQRWPSYMDNDNILGQMEAELGEYAWGYSDPDSLWTQYFA